MRAKTVVFLINLVQDVNIIRGLAHLVVKETDATVSFLISDRFIKRDALTIWQSELAHLASDLQAPMHFYNTPAEAFAVLQGGEGVIIAASESDLGAHRDTHNVFQVAPPGYIKITLQHGLECVGFLQSREHVIGHGRDIGFGADIVCGWFDRARLSSLTATERGKLCVTGPPTVLSKLIKHPNHPPPGGGIVCENMHSVRLVASGNHRAGFMDIFFEFCAAQRAKNERVTLRPHPGGQYVLKNKVPLPPNVSLNNLPMFSVDMASYSFGISAPSTIVFDMVLAGLPVGVWRDAAGIMDAGNYSGLTEVSSLEDWLALARDARLRRDMLIAKQNRFLDRLGVIHDPQEVYRRFARLLTGALSRSGGPKVVAKAAPKRATKNVVVIANGDIPTYQICFAKPLFPMIAKKHVALTLIAESHYKEKFRAAHRSGIAREEMERDLRAAKPDVIVCCRYSGPFVEMIHAVVKDLNIPLVYHLDDDLLNVPRELGPLKFEFHNRPERLKTVRYLLEHADLIYASNRRLKRLLKHLGVRKPIQAGSIVTTLPVLRTPKPGPLKRIGYMGFDHAHDFQLVVPSLEAFLAENPKVEFELIGKIPLPDELLRFGSRVKVLPPVFPYEAFLEYLAGREWDVGICPLTKSSFNLYKSNNKWVEYTGCGIASIGTRGMIYEECMADGRGLLVHDDEWLGAFRALAENPQTRQQMVLRAQTHLLTKLSLQKHTNEVLAVLDLAEKIKRQGASTEGLMRLKRPAKIEDQKLAWSGGDA